MHSIEEVVKLLYPIIKTMKASMDDVVVVYNRHIIVRTDKCRLAVTELDTDTFVSFVCVFKNIEKYIKGEDIFLYNRDMPKFYELVDLHDKYVSFNKVLYSTDDLKLSHPELFEMKSTSGYDLLDFGGKKVIMFAGIVSALKSDTISLDMYEGDMPGTYIMRYDIYKSKLKLTISIYTLNMELK